MKAGMTTVTMMMMMIMIIFGKSLKEVFVMLLQELSRCSAADLVFDAQHGPYVLTVQGLGLRSAPACEFF